MNADCMAADRQHGTGARIQSLRDRLDAGRVRQYTIPLPENADDGGLYWELAPYQLPIEAPAYLYPVVAAAARERYNEDRTRILIGAAWIDLNTGTAVTLPLP